MTRNYKQPGFTIVELLIVIVVIAILAAITIVAYNGIQNRAKASAAQQAVSQANKKIMAFAIDNTDSYPIATGVSGIDNLATLGITNGDTTYQYSSNNSASPRTFCITATNGNQSFYISNSSSAPTAGACPGHGANGVAAITNLVSNPKAGVNITGWFVTTTNTANTTGRLATGGPLASAPSFYRTTWSTAHTTNGVIAATIVISGVNPGTIYSFSGYARPSWTGAVTRAQINWQDAGGATTIATSVGGATAHPANTWQQRFVSGTAPAGAAQALLYLRQDSGAGTLPGAGATLDASAYMFTEGSAQYSYADGDSSNWAWNGTPNNSSSSGPAL